jgi:hypothetical protein
VRTASAPAIASQNGQVGSVTGAFCRYDETAACTPLTSPP